MPHIFVNGTNTSLQIQEIHIHARIVFKQEVHRSIAARYKLEDLQNKLEKLIEEYYEGKDISSDIISNHEYNQMMNNL